MLERFYMLVAFALFMIAEAFSPDPRAGDFW